MKIVDLYVTGSKGTNADLARRLGLSKEATELFIYAALEVKLTVSIDEAGAISILAVEDEPLAKHAVQMSCEECGNYFFLLRSVVEGGEERSCPECGAEADKIVTLSSFLS